MSKHTPGPWRAEPTAAVPNVVEVFAGEMVVARAYGHHAPPGLARRVLANVNARLIAAAPELYEALTAAADVLHEGLPVSAVIRAALAKVENQHLGRSQDGGKTCDFQGECPACPRESYEDTHSYTRNAHTSVGGEGE